MVKKSSVINVGAANKQSLNFFPNAKTGCLPTVNDIGGHPVLISAY